MTKATHRIATLLAATCLMAQITAAETLSGADCAKLWQDASVLTGSFETRTVDKITTVEGWCQLDGVRLGSMAPYSPRFQIARLSFRGEGLAGLFDFGEPPVSFDLTLEDLVVSVTIADPVMTYLIAAQAGARGIDADLSIGWQAASQTLSLHHLKLDFTGDNEITAAATVHGVDLSSAAAAQASLSTLRISAIEGSILSNGLFENYALVPLGTMVLGATEDPEARVLALKSQAAVAIAALPEPQFSAATRSALTVVLAQMPNPAGRLDFQLLSESGLGLDQLTSFALLDGPEAVAAMAGLFASVTGQATFVPTKPK